MSTLQWIYFWGKIGGMDATQATLSALLTPAPTISQTFGMNPFEFWAMVIGTFSAVFGVVIAILVFILGLQVWQQYKLREKAEMDNETIKKIVKEMTELKTKQQELFDANLASMQKIIEDVGKSAEEVKTISASTQGENDKVKRISKEIEQKANDLRGSAVSLGNISLGTISANTIIEPYSTKLHVVSPLDSYMPPLSVPGVSMTLDDIMKRAKNMTDKEK